MNAGQTRIHNASKLLLFIEEKKKLMLTCTCLIYRTGKVLGSAIPNKRLLEDRLSIFFNT